MNEGRAARRRIIIVDDDPAVCEQVARRLTSLGYRVASVADGCDALNIELDDEIEVIGDRVEVTARLRQAPLVRRIELVAETRASLDRN